ncbi:LysR family transcriptional regulator [Paracraurococcus lichenis]|uniref:LysR family transcriptional regulator n=1 Tax=Paracraurococcus lichenis TaxID=3064888 RepID=A0ABT9DUF0_9PROT|nr:LysR family transcriptional regulator [Paracraurococcus sp. LOR1-02]MDO9707526.1 LysR family transcriptional regulator [Paracraurococcus sp. LOR1-02]
MDNLRRLDLNLLVALDALLAEAHVSRAARRLGLSQPATSAALERLRHLFRDPLLERTRGGMRPTPRAEALRAPLRAALDAVAGVLGAAEPDLAGMRRPVRLLLADAPALEAATLLVARLAATAPGVTPVLLPWRGAPDALARLAAGEADLVASVLPPLGPEFRSRPLFEESYCIAMRLHHPAVAGFDLDRWLAHPHVVVSGRGEAATPLDAQLAALGRSRRVGAVVPSFLMVPPLLLRSDLIALLPGRCIPPDLAGELATFAPPVPVDGFRLGLAWHVRRESDALVRHVAALLAGVLGGDPMAGAQA